MIKQTVDDLSAREFSKYSRLEFVIITLLHPSKLEHLSRSFGKPDDASWLSLPNGRVPDLLSRKKRWDFVKSPQVSFVFTFFVVNFPNLIVFLIAANPLKMV